MKAAKGVPTTGMPLTGTIAAGPPALQARGVVKRYGALVATDDVSLDVAAGEVHALIGPNGAGKSTLIQLLAGSLEPDAGSLQLEGQDVTTWPVHRRVGAGLARSFQITSVFPRLSVEENLMLALQASSPRRFGMWRPRSQDVALRRQAHELADGCGLPRSQWGLAAGTLPHAQQRKVEFALALASRPRVLLLDEPMAGMGPEDSAALADLIESLKGELAILLVEHDMDTVFRLADRISVLVYGRLIATGTPQQIRADTRVQQAYLGTEESSPPRAADSRSGGAA